MGTPNAAGDWSSEMEVNAFRRLFPVHYYERHLSESIRPMLDPWKKTRDTIVSLGAVASSDGSLLTMLAAIKIEVMTPVYSPGEGSIAVEFHMPPICSPVGRWRKDHSLFQCDLHFMEMSALHSFNLVADTLRVHLEGSGMIDLKELFLIKGEAAWMVYLDIYSLDADGALFDAALLSAVAAFSHVRIPGVSLNDEGRMVMVSEELEGEKLDKEPVDKERRKLLLKSIPFSLICILHKNHILADPTFEESILETFMTVVLNSSGQLVSLYKPGGPVLAHTSAIQECVALTGQRMKELKEIIDEAISTMEID
ncbi:hypothetical protein EUGRSUZ_A00069 [Eucalyptus grandis]|uniref:Ribosomal RNA-processing protein 43 n=2 Tax=Eucalyptus grandis TaxID=71139 RepID=A0A059DB13_EUCGR|nr:hypothetical protein EUGRSUZ_A00069 [Eucalyptus grandis]